MLMNRKTMESPLQKHTKSVPKAPDGEREMKHKYCCDVGHCFLSFTDWNLQRVENNNLTIPRPSYYVPWSFSNPQHLFYEVSAKFLVYPRNF